MIRIAPLIADTDQYIGIVYTTKVLIFQVNSTEHDFDSISTIKTDFILDAALSNSAASRTIQCAVVTAAGLRVYVCCGNTVSTLLECDLTYAWPNTKSISVAWMHGADQSESQSLFVSSGSALYAISTAPAVTCECCSVSFAGGVKLETVRAEAIDIQQIFEFAGPSRSIALINRSRFTSAYYILWCTTASDSKQLDVQWEVSTLSTACTFCCSSADQSLYCIAGGVLSRYDESGMSWSHALDHSEYPAEAVATSFSVIPSRPSSSSDLISNEFIVGLHAEAEESCVFVKLNVKERWSRLRHDALARVSLDSVVAIAQQSAPVRPSCCDPLDISSFQRCPLAWASCVIPLVCWSEVGHLHVVAAHPAFGSSFLKLTDVQALHTGISGIISTAAGYPCSQVDRIGPPSHVLCLRGNCDWHSSQKTIFKVRHDGAAGLIIGCVDSSGSVLYRCDEGYGLDPVYYRDEIGSIMSIGDYAFDVGPAAAVDLRLFLCGVSVLSSRSTEVSSAHRVDWHRNRVHTLSETSSFGFDTSTHTIGLFSASSDIIVQVTSGCLYFLDTKTLRLIKRLTRVDVKLPGKITFAALEVIYLGERREDHVVICLATGNSVCLVLIPISSLSGAGLVKPLVYNVVQFKCRNEISALCTTVLIRNTALKRRTARFAGVAHSDFLLALGLWNEGSVCVVSLSNDGKELVKLPEIAYDLELHAKGLQFCPYENRGIDNCKKVPLVALWMHTDHEFGVCNYMSNVFHDSAETYDLSCEGSSSDEIIKFSIIKFRDEIIGMEAVLPHKVDLMPTLSPGCSCIIAWTRHCGFVLYTEPTHSVETFEHYCISFHRLLNVEPCHSPIIVYENGEEKHLHSTERGLHQILKRLSFVWLQKPEDENISSGVVQLKRCRVNVHKRRHYVRSFVQIAGRIISINSLPASDIDYFICEFIPKCSSMQNGVSIRLFNCEDLSCLYSIDTGNTCSFKSVADGKIVKYSSPLCAAVLQPVKTELACMRHSGISFVVCFRTADNTEAPDLMCHVSFVTFAMSLSEDGKRQLIAISNLSNAKISEYPELNRPLRPTDFKVSMMLDTDAFLSASYGRLSVVKRISGLFEGREDELHIVSTAQLPPQHAPVISLVATDCRVVVSIAIIGLQIFSFDSSSSRLEPLYFLDLGPSVLLTGIHFRSIQSTSLINGDEWLREDLIIGCTERVSNRPLLLHIPIVSCSIQESAVIIFSPDCAGCQANVVSIYEDHQREDMPIVSSQKLDICRDTPLGNHLEAWRLIASSSKSSVIMASIDLEIFFM